MSSAATDRRPPSSTFKLAPLNDPTIINDNEFPTLGARGTPSSGGFSPLPTTSAPFGQSQSPIPFKDAISSHRNYGGSWSQFEKSANDFAGKMTSDFSCPVPEGLRNPAGVWGQGATNTVGLMRGPDSLLSNADFQIQSEDFPALPGSQFAGSSLLPPPPSLLSATAATTATANEMLSAGQSNNEDGSGKNNSTDPPRGIVTNSNGEVSNIPPTMLADQFGMAGLVTYLRTVDNPSIVSLALGYDLTTLGLNLNMNERLLYETFGGPWAEQPIRPHEHDTKVPEEYLTNAHIRDKLPPVKLNKLSEDVLFFLFYNCPGEVYQMAAACELYSRDWRFYKGDNLWVTRSQYGGVKEQTSTYEKGQYNVFDPMQWRKIPKELKLVYNDLEERPKLPPAFTNHGTVGGVSVTGGSI